MLQKTSSKLESFANSFNNKTFQGGRRKTPDIPKVRQTQQRYQGNRSVLKEKGHAYYKRGSFKELSRDELLHIYKNIKVTRPQYFKDVVRPLAKKFAKELSSGWGGRQIYFDVLNELLSDGEKNRWVSKFDARKNKDPFNRMEICYGYTVTGIQTETGRNINVGGFSKLYSGRPRDAAALIPYLIAHSHSGLIKGIYDDLSGGQNLDIIRGYPGFGDIDTAFEDSKRIVIRFNAKIKREFRPKDNGKGVVRLPESHVCDLEYKVEAILKRVGQGNDFEVEKSKTEAIDGRQECKYKLPKKHVCIPDHRRGEFLNKPGMKNLFKFQAQKRAEEAVTTEKNKRQSAKRKKRQAKRAERETEMIDLMTRAKNIDWFKSVNFSDDLANMDPVFLDLLGPDETVNLDFKIKLDDVNAKTVEKILEEASKKAYSERAIKKKKNRIKKLQNKLKRNIGKGMEDFIKGSTVIYDKCFGFTPSMNDFEAISKFVIDYPKHPTVQEWKDNIDSNNACDYWGALYIAAIKDRRSNETRRSNIKKIYESGIDNTQLDQIQTRLKQLEREREGQPLEERNRLIREARNIRKTRKLLLEEKENQLRTRKKKIDEIIKPLNQIKTTEEIIERIEELVGNKLDDELVTLFKTVVRERLDRKQPYYKMLKKLKDEIGKLKKDPMNDNIANKIVLNLMVFQKDIEAFKQERDKRFKDEDDMKERIKTARKEMTGLTNLGKIMYALLQIKKDNIEQIDFSDMGDDEFDDIELEEEDGEDGGVQLGGAPTKATVTEISKRTGLTNTQIRNIIRMSGITEFKFLVSDKDNNMILERVKEPVLFIDDEGEVVVKRDTKNETWNTTEFDEDQIKESFNKEDLSKTTGFDKIRKLVRAVQSTENVEDIANMSGFLNINFDDDEINAAVGKFAGPNIINELEKAQEKQKVLLKRRGLREIQGLTDAGKVVYAILELKKQKESEEEARENLVEYMEEDFEDENFKGGGKNDPTIKEISDRSGLSEQVVRDVIGASLSLIVKEKSTYKLKNIDNPFTLNKDGTVSINEDNIPIKLDNLKNVQSSFDSNRIQKYMQRKLKTVRKNPKKTLKEIAKSPEILEEIAEQLQEGDGEERELTLEDFNQVFLEDKMKELAKDFEKFKEYIELSSIKLTNDEMNVLEDRYKKGPKDDSIVRLIAYMIENITIDDDTNAIPPKNTLVRDLQSLIKRRLTLITKKLEKEKSLEERRQKLTKTKVIQQPQEFNMKKQLQKSKNIEYKKQEIEREKNRKKQELEKEKQEKEKQRKNNIIRAIDKKQLLINENLETIINGVRGKLDLVQSIIVLVVYISEKPQQREEIENIVRKIMTNVVKEEDFDDDDELEDTFDELEKDGVIKYKNGVVLNEDDEDVKKMISEIEELII